MIGTKRSIASYSEVMVDHPTAITSDSDHVYGVRSLSPLESERSCREEDYLNDM